MRDKLNEFDALCNKVCVDLPEGFQIVVTLELNSGDVELFDPDGVKIDFPSNRENMTDQVNDALEAANDEEQT